MSVRYYDGEPTTEELIEEGDKNVSDDAILQSNGS